MKAGSSLCGSRWDSGAGALLAPSFSSAMGAGMSLTGQFLTESCANEFGLNFSIIMEDYQHFMVVARVV